MGIIMLDGDVCDGVVLVLCMKALPWLTPVATEIPLQFPSEEYFSLFSVAGYAGLFVLLLEIVGEVVSKIILCDCYS